MVLKRTVAGRSSPKDVILGRKSQLPPKSLNQAPFVGTRIVIAMFEDGSGSLSCGKMSSLQSGSVRVDVTALNAYLIPRELDGLFEN